MTTTVIPEILTDTKLIFFKYEENFTSRNSVRLQVDPTPYILYWRYKDYKVFNTKELAHEKNYIYLERIYDVRVGKPTDFDLVLHEKNFEKNFLTIVSGASITTLKFTHFVCLDNDEKKLQNFANSLFTLVQRIRREEHGLLYHFRKKLAPKMYAAFTQRCLEEDRLTSDRERNIIEKTQKCDEIFELDIFDLNFFHRFFFEIRVEQCFEVVGMVGEELEDQAFFD